MYISLRGLGAWYDSITFDKQAVGDWARRLDSSLPADNSALIARISRTPGQGGGFVAGGVRMCMSNRPGGPTEPMRRADQPCPPGSGGMAGEQVKEMMAEEIRQFVQQQQQAEAAERERIGQGGQARLVEVYGTVVDGLGNPVAGASVTVGAAVAITDAAGLFSAVVQPGTVSITVKATGFADRRVDGIRVLSYAPRDAGSIVLIRTAAAGGPGDGEFKEDAGAAAKPWYRSKWTYIIGGIMLVGGGIVFVASRRRR